VQLDAVEAGLPGAARSGGEPARDLPDLTEPEVLDRLPIAVAEIAPVARAREVGPELGLEARIALGQRRRRQLAALDHAFDELARRLAPRDLQEVDDLGHDQGGGEAAHLLAQRGQPRHVAVVREPQQRAAGHVADTRRLEHDHARAALGVAQVDLADRVGDETVLGAAPGDHRGQPDAVRQLEPAATDRERLEEPRPGPIAHGVRLRAPMLGFSSGPRQFALPGPSASSSPLPRAISFSMPWSIRRRRSASKPRRSGGGSSR